MSKKKKPTLYRCTTLTYSSLYIGHIKVLGFLTAPFLTGNIRKILLLAVERKKTEILLIYVPGLESKFGVILWVSVITDRTEHRFTE